MARPDWCDDNIAYAGICGLYEFIGEPIPPVPPIIPALHPRDFDDIMLPLEAEVLATGRVNPQTLMSIAQNYLDAGAPDMALKISEFIPKLPINLGNDEETVATLRGALTIQNQALQLMGRERQARAVDRLSLLLNRSIS